MKHEVATGGQCETGMKFSPLFDKSPRPGGTTVFRTLPLDVAAERQIQAVHDFSRRMLRRGQGNANITLKQLSN